jgi:hypothetical protein
MPEYKVDAVNIEAVKAAYRMKFFSDGSRRRMDIACGWSTQSVLIFLLDSIHKRLTKI